MHLNYLALALVALEVGLVAAAPHSGPALRRRADGFQVHRVPVKTQPRNTVKEMKKVYAKYNMVLPDVLANTDEHAWNAPQKRSPAAAGQSTTGYANNGSVTTYADSYKTEWLAPVSIGGQLVYLDFDTGSSDLWVWNPNLLAANLTGRRIYDPNKSATARPLPGSTFNAHYYDKSFANTTNATHPTVFTDTVKIGNATAMNQTVELPTSLGTSFTSPNSVKADGLLGLAFGKLNSVRPQQAKTFPETMGATFFTAQLNRVGPGSYGFNYFNHSAFAGNLSATKIADDSGYWSVPSETFQVGNGSVQPNVGATSIADTGTTLMVVNPAVVKAVYAQVPGAVIQNSTQLWYFPCNETLPDVRIAFGQDTLVTIPSDLLIFAQAGYVGESLLCYGSFQSNNGHGFQILGDIMFQAQYVVFDLASQAIAIAPHIERGNINTISHGIGQVSPPPIARVR